MSDVVAMGVPLSGQVSHPLVILERSVQFSLLKQCPGKHVGCGSTEPVMWMIRRLTQRIGFLHHPPTPPPTPMVRQLNFSNSTRTQGSPGSPFFCLTGNALRGE